MAEVNATMGQKWRVPCCFRDGPADKQKVPAAHLLLQLLVDLSKGQEQQVSPPLQGAWCQACTWGAP